MKRGSETFTLPASAYTRKNIFVYKEFWQQGEENLARVSLMAA